MNINYDVTNLANICMLLIMTICKQAGKCTGGEDVNLFVKGGCLMGRTIGIVFLGILNVLTLFLDFFIVLVRMYIFALGFEHLYPLLSQLLESYVTSSCKILI